VLAKVFANLAKRCMLFGTGTLHRLAGVLGKGVCVCTHTPQACHAGYPPSWGCQKKNQVLFCPTIHQIMDTSQYHNPPDHSMDFLEKHNPPDYVTIVWSTTNSQSILGVAGKEHNVIKPCP
jgi:hypothetical protein